MELILNEEDLFTYVHRLLFSSPLVLPSTYPLLNHLWWTYHVESLWWIDCGNDDLGYVVLITLQALYFGLLVTLVLWILRSDDMAKYARSQLLPDLNELFLASNLFGLGTHRVV